MVHNYYFQTKLLIWEGDNSTPEKRVSYIFIYWPMKKIMNNLFTRKNL